MATPPNQTNPADIQNSEKLLDLSNQLIDSINERRKLLKGINAEEQLYFATVKQQQKLSQDIADNAEKYLGYQIKSKDLSKQFKATEDNKAKTAQAFAKIQGNITKNYQDALKANTQLVQQIDKENKLNTSLSNELDRRVRKYNDLKTRKEQGEQISARELKTAYLAQKNLIEEVKTSDNLLKTLEKQQQEQEDKAKTAAEIIKNGNESLKAQKEELDFLNRNLHIRKQIEKSTGLLGGLTKAASKIPGIGQYLNADEAIEEMEKLAAQIEESGQSATSFSNRLKIGFKGISVLGKGLVDNLKSPEAIFTFIISQGLKANAQSVALGKSLGFGADKANKFRENLAERAKNSTNVNVTAESLVESFNELSSTTGFVANYSADTLETQVMLTKQLGLSGEEAAHIYEMSVLTGKSSSKVNDEMLGAFVNTRNAAKVGVNFKQVMAEASKISGQLQANFAGNPAKITAAIVKAKALGTTLEQTKDQGEKLLDFASSLESELKAELLTGKQLNLERARAAALAGDQVSLAEELNKNVGTYEDFSKMNVLQQKALAEAVGLTADQLAEQLKKQKLAQESGKSLAEITKDEAAEAEKRQSVQDKFNAAILKLQDFFGNLVAGPVGQLLEAITNIVGLVVNVLQPALAVVFTPLNWAVGLLGKMEGLLKGILVVYAAIKGYQLGINIAAGVEEAMMLTKLGLMEGEITYLTIKEATEGRSLATKIALYALNLKDVVVTGAIAAYEAIKNSSIVAQISKLPALIGLKSTEATVATEAAAAEVVGAEAISFGTATAWIVGGLAAVLGAMALFKGNDVVSPGYGKRTLMSPEGAIALNDKDTVIAGTDLGGGKGNGGSAVSIDLSPMIAAINAVKASVDKLYAKDSSIHMDGKKVGTTLSQGTHKVA
jgi:hypothetical protein